MCYLRQVPPQAPQQREVSHDTHAYGESLQSQRFDEAFDSYWAGRIRREEELRHHRTVPPLGRSRSAHPLATSLPASARAPASVSLASSRSSLSLIRTPRTYGIEGTVTEASLLEIKAFADSLEVFDRTSSDSGSSTNGRVYWEDLTRSTSSRGDPLISGSRSTINGLRNMASRTVSTDEKGFATSDFEARSNSKQSFLAHSGHSQPRHPSVKPISPYLNSQGLFSDGADSSVMSVLLQDRSRSAASSVSGYTSRGSSAGGSYPASESSAPRLCQPLSTAKSPKMALGSSLSGRSCMVNYGTPFGVSISRSATMMDASGAGLLGDVLPEEEEGVGELSKFIEERLKAIMGLTVDR